MKTYSPKAGTIDRTWYVVDADGVVLGRLASEVAKILRGKHKPIYAPHLDTGDHVVVVNASKVRLTGDKLQSKIYYRHSGYPGGLREIPYERLMQTRPQLAVEKAVRGMLPKTRLGRQMARKLKVYPGPDHPHGPQRPVPLKVGDVPGGGEVAGEKVTGGPPAGARGRAPAARKRPSKRGAPARPRKAQKKEES